MLIARVEVARRSLPQQEWGSDFIDFTASLFLRGVNDTMSMWCRIRHTVPKQEQKRSSLGVLLVVLALFVIEVYI
jgi:hypothetical protein